METLISLTSQPAFDIQLDVHLESGDVAFSGGPDRAYLYLPYNLPGAAGRPDRRDGAELLALWLVGVSASVLLTTALGAALPQTAELRPFEITWIRDGKIAVKRQRVGVDAAMWLIAALATENQLDYAAHLFGGHGINEG